METVDAIVAAFGGAKALGSVLGISAQAVSNMRSRGSIPSEYWQDLVGAAAIRAIEGITLESLSTIAARKRRASPAGAAA